MRTWRCSQRGSDVLSGAHQGLETHSLVTDLTTAIPLDTAMSLRSLAVPGMTDAVALWEMR